MSQAGASEAARSSPLRGPAGIFCAGELDPATFDHRQHVAVAHSLLQQCSFLQSLYLYVRGLEDLTRRAGVPEKFHFTITTVFLSAIAERLASRPEGSFDDFWAAHPELHDDRLLRVAYSPGRLHSEAARRHLLMPDRGFATNS